MRFVAKELILEIVAFLRTYRLSGGGRGGGAVNCFDTTFEFPSTSSVPATRECNQSSKGGVENGT